MDKSPSSVLRVILPVLLLVSGHFVFAQPATPVVATPEREIVLGMSTALTGPSSELGQRMLLGVSLAVDEKNANGGVKGAKLRLVALDDQYDPNLTAANMRQLIEKEKCVAIIGNVGTPTAVVSIPMCNAAHVPFVGAFSGAGSLRKNPPDRYVINYRASYNEEITNMVDGLLSHTDITPSDFAFFTQRDTFGDSGYNAGVAALKRHSLEDEALIPHVRYERGGAGVEDALASLISLRKPPKAVIVVATYGACAHFISLSHSVRFFPLFLAVSFVGTRPLIAELGNNGEGTIITQVVPPYAGDAPAAHSYLAALQTYRETEGPCYTSFEGYVAAQMLITGIERTSGAVDSEAIVNALEGLGKFDLGLGVPLSLGATEHQACHTVWPTVIRNSEAIALDWESLRAPIARKGN